MTSSEKEEKFRIALSDESDFPLTDNIYNMLISNSDELVFQRGEKIINSSRVNRDIYVLKEGVVRGYITKRGVENNVSFGLEGTVFASMQSYSLGLPSMIILEACCPSKALRIKKKTLDKMLVESNEFCRWFGGIFTRRSCFVEIKNKVMNGDAKWRYEWLEKCRPELFEHVPLKAIASYLKMTEVHVSRIRKQIAEDKKKKEEKKDRNQ